MKQRVDPDMVRVASVLRDAGHVTDVLEEVDGEAGYFQCRRQEGRVCVRWVPGRRRIAAGLGGPVDEMGWRFGDCRCRSHMMTAVRADAARMCSMAVKTLSRAGYRVDVSRSQHHVCVEA